MMRTIIKNKRIYRKKIGRLPSTSEDPAGDNVNSADGDQEAANEGSGDEHETFSISGDDEDKDEEGCLGKRKMAVQGGAGGKKAKV